ncbi:MAG TPA: DUF349 domain-containing protein [Flavobacteriia bacterium]|nr:DUF349 domain-containing protein [Flavobacteriia bacterium]
MMLENNENLQVNENEATNNETAKNEILSNEKIVENNEPEVLNPENIEKTDYTTFTLEELYQKFDTLLKSDAIQKVKDEANEIKDQFNKKFKKLIEEKKQEFIKEGGNEIDFHFDFPLKNKFFNLVKDFRNKLQNYYNQKEEERKTNYTKKLGLIEELKSILATVEANQVYPELKKIQERWKKIGSVPFDKSEDLWRTFRFHEQKVYDFLHLNSDFRDLDYKHNLEKKTKMVERAEELAQEPDVNKAFKELQILHRIWKEEVGPVAREYREEIWERFSNATKTIHDKRRKILSELEKKYEENIPKKEEVIRKINTLVDENITSHNQWQEKIKELEALREEFFKIGKVTKEKSEELWQALREATRNFNQEKNSFYKSIKDVHHENLEKKKALVAKAQELKDSEDLKHATEIFKKIQAEWKTIGHIPRKYSDKLWNEFRGACNHFFDRLHAVQDEENKELLEVFNKKKEYLEKIKEEVKENAEISLDKVKEYINEWKELGRVPEKMRFIESKFNKLIDKLFSKLDMDKTEAVMQRFKNTIENYIEDKNFRKIDNEALFIRKKIDEIQREIKLLENNLGFFQNSSKDNPMVKNVYKNIEKYKEDLKIWKEKLKYIKSLDY